MAQMIHFPTDPADPVELLELDGPEDLSAFFCDQFDAVHGQGWTVYLWTDPQPRAYTPEDLNHQAAAFLNAHAANGRTDWDTFLRGPVLLACRPALTFTTGARPGTWNFRAFPIRLRKTWCSSSRLPLTVGSGLPFPGGYFGQELRQLTALPR